MYYTFTIKRRNFFKPLHITGISVNNFSFNYLLIMNLCVDSRTLACLLPIQMHKRPFSRPENGRNRKWLFIWYWPATLR